MNEKQIDKYANLRKILDKLMEELGREDVGYICTFTFKLPNNRFGTLQHTGGDCQDLALEVGTLLYEENKKRLKGDH